MSNHRNYSVITGGHAPGDYRDSFLDALDAYGDWAEEGPEPSVDLKGNAVSISQVCGHVWNCTDVLPNSACRALADYVSDNGLNGCTDEEFPEVATYAQGARRLKDLILETS